MKINDFGETYCLLLKELFEKEACKLFNDRIIDDCRDEFLQFSRNFFMKYLEVELSDTEIELVLKHLKIKSL